MKASVLLLGLIFVAAACASSQPGSSYRNDTITRTDIQGVPASYNNAFQVVERLRPQWLQKRGDRLALNEYQEAMDGEIVVYVDDSRMGGPDALRHVGILSIAEIRYLDPAKAARYGTGHQHGAILVRTQ